MALCFMSNMKLGMEECAEATRAREVGDWSVARAMVCAAGCGGDARGLHSGHGGEGMKMCVHLHGLTFCCFFDVWGVLAL